MGMYLLLISLFAQVNVSDLPPAQRSTIGGDYYVPHTLSTFPYLIEQSKWQGQDPLKLIKDYYQTKKIPAVIVYADYLNGIKLEDNVMVVGQVTSSTFTQNATKLAEAAINEVDPKYPENGADGVLIVLKGRGARAIAVAIPSYTIASGPMLDHNAFTDLFSGVQHAPNPLR